MDALLERLRAVEDRLAILQLEGAYSAAYDSGRGKDWAELFTEDGIYQTRSREGMPEVNFVQGRQALAQFCNSNPLRCIHYINVPDIVIAGIEARGRVHFTYRGIGEDAFRRVITTEVEGYYDVAYRRTDAGWKIRRRFTVYFDRRQGTTFGYEKNPSPFEDENPPMRTGGNFIDGR